jgi:hypothetical protein
MKRNEEKEKIWYAALSLLCLKCACVFSLFIQMCASSGSCLKLKWLCCLSGKAGSSKIQPEMKMTK